MLRRGIAFLVLVLTVLTLRRVAHADQPGPHTVPVAVLAFDSEDAEEQADAITGAVRSRIRAAQGWSLIDTTQSLGMLTAAMKCPARPPLECQQNIAEQIKAERYIWGIVSKGPGAGQVTAEIHLYQKAKADTVLKESYADNLKDANDDTLRKIAARIVEHLGGTAVGVVVVRSATQAGEVVIDGEKRVPLQGGSARIELAAGGHSIEIADASGAPIKRNIVVAAGRETVVELSPGGAPEASGDGHKTRTRKIIGGASMGVGAVLGGIAVYSLVHYLDLQKDGEAAAARTPQTNPPTPCRDQSSECARIDKSAKTASGLAWGLGGGAVLALGFGAYMFFSEPSASSTQTAAAPPKPKTRVIPTASASSGGLLVVGSF